MQLEKSYSGGGIEELVVVAELVVSGSVKSTLFGKYYNGRLRLQKLTAEALLHILLKDYITNNPMTTDNLMHITKLTTEEQHEEFVTSVAFNSSVNDVFKIFLTSGADMAEFWLSYIKDVKILLQRYHCLIKVW